MTTRSDLEQQLRVAASNDAWVEILARYFEQHGLTFGHGTDNAGDEAFWLIRHLQEWRDEAWEAAPDPRLAPAAAALAERRALERRPLAYLLGETFFAGLRFRVDERVLVPRSPLAEVIEREFAPWCVVRPGERVLDIGTGSGCLAIAAAHYCRDALVDATDVSADALAVARANVELHGVEDRVRLVEADLYPPGEQRYRVIMSNRPYVPDAEVAVLPPEYGHEPAIGLAGGETGFDLVERIVAGARERLLPGGVLLVEVGAGAETFADRHRELPLIWLHFERGGDGVFVLTAEDLP